MGRKKEKREEKPINHKVKKMCERLNDTEEEKIDEEEIRVSNEIRKRKKNFGLLIINERNMKRKRS